MPTLVNFAAKCTALLNQKFDNVTHVPTCRPNWSVTPSSDQPDLCPEFYPNQRAQRDPRALGAALPPTCRGPGGGGSPFIILELVLQANAAYLAELEAEKEKMESSEEAVREGGTNHLLRLLETEILHVQGGGGRSGGQREHIKYFDIYRERPVRLTVRALIPVREHPKVARSQSPPYSLAQKVSKLAKHVLPEQESRAFQAVPAPGKAHFSPPLNLLNGHLCPSPVTSAPQQSFHLPLCTCFSMEGVHFWQLGKLGVIYLPSSRPPS